MCVCVSIYIHTYIYIYIYKTDSLCCASETNSILSQLYANKIFLEKNNLADHCE